MSWFRVDDKSAFHRKVLRAGNQAWGALCRAGAWSSDHGTDGMIPQEIAELIEPSSKVWIKLETVGLATKIETGWNIHDYLQWNPSASEVDEKRVARAKAGKRGGERSAESKAKAQANAKQLLEQTPSSRLDVASDMFQAKPNPNPFPSISSSEPLVLCLPSIEPATKGPDDHTRSPNVAKIIDALAGSDVTKAHANDSYASKLEGRRIASGTRIEDVLAAISDAVADAVEAELWNVTWNRIRVYCDAAKKRAAARAAKSGPAPRYVNDRVQHDPPGVQGWKPAKPIDPTPMTEDEQQRWLEGEST